MESLGDRYSLPIRNSLVVQAWSLLEVVAERTKCSGSIAESHFLLYWGEIQRVAASTQGVDLVGRAVARARILEELHLVHAGAASCDVI